MGSEVDYSSDEDTDVSESEIEEYEDKAYEELKSGRHHIQISDQAYTCPYCPKKKKRDYLYKDLLQHANGVGKCNSQKRSVRDKANHLALAKYLEKDLAVVAGPSRPVAEADPLADHDGDEMFVWPWIGIVVNLPTQWKDGRYVGESGSKLRDQLIRRGFNPIRVHPLWNFRGHSGSAVVEFNKDWSGFNNAMSFEKAYEADHHGKKDWQPTDAKNLIFMHGLLVQMTTIPNASLGNIFERLVTLEPFLISWLMKLGRQVKKMHLKQMEENINETSKSLSMSIAEKDKLHQDYNEVEIKRIQSSAREHFQKIFNDHEKLKVQLETQKKELELKGNELEKRETRNENERKKLFEEIEKVQHLILNALENSSLQTASEEQKKADENVMKLAEIQK
ncbi:unnamed protein product, partial [Ilex paraguariensis]